MTGAFPNQANPNGVDLGRVGPSRAGMLMDASFSVGFTYGYSRCPASRDPTHMAGLTEGGSYLSEYDKSIAMSCRRRLLWRPMQRTDAAPANRVGGDIELPPEFHSGITVDDFDERLLVNVADGPMEEARAHRTVGFDDRRNPGRVASRRDRSNLTQLRSKMAHDAAEFSPRSPR